MGYHNNFKKIASICFNLKQINANILDSSEIEIEYQSIENEKYKSYIGYRNGNFDLQIFESIILSNIDTPINNENLESHLGTYFQLIQDSYVKMILENRIIQDEELSKKLVGIIFEKCIEFDCKEYILNTKNIYSHLDNIKIVLDAIEVLELEENEINQIISVYTIQTFDGKITRYCESIDKDTLVQNLEKTKTEIEKLAIKRKEGIANNISKLINDLN